MLIHICTGTRVCACMSVYVRARARARMCVCVASLLVFKDSAIVQSIYNEIASMTRNVDYVVRKKIRVSGIKYICVCVCVCVCVCIYIYIYFPCFYIHIYIYIYI